MLCHKENSTGFNQQTVGLAYTYIAETVSDRALLQDLFQACSGRYPVTCNVGAPADETMSLTVHCLGSDEHVAYFENFLNNANAHNPELHVQPGTALETETPQIPGVPISDKADDSEKRGLSDSSDSEKLGKPATPENTSTKSKRK